MLDMLKRKSHKSEKATKPHHLSIPPKDPLAIVPPKKVIRALYDYHSPDSGPDSGYLSFSTGDFLHVIGREDDPDWYEACNPLQGARGLVPAKYFQEVGKQQVRDSAGSTNSVHSQATAGHDSGYAEGKLSANGSGGGLENGQPKPIRMSKALAKGSPATIYGTVEHKFEAERPDELDAEQGDYVIIIAQSNPEWFVAKRIGKLGGPGLIPVSFIAIRGKDNEKVPDPVEAVKRAGVPSVEEWKRMAAEYKNSSIPLGKLESNTVQSLQQGVQRMSVNSKTQPSSQHNRATSSFSQQTQRVSRPLLAPVQASVPEYGFANENFHFIVTCQMEDGRYMRLERTYQNFYDLQINLIQEFPQEAGNVNGIERSLPYMPGPVTYVTDNITLGRRAHLDEYLGNLLKLGPHITHGRLLREFFSPRGNDMPDPNVYSTENGYRLSGTSQQSDRSPTDSRQSSTTGNTYNGQPQYATNADYGYQTKHQRAQSSVSSQNHLNHHRNQSDLQVPPPMIRNNSALTQASASSANSSMATRIKARFKENEIEETFVIKVQQPYSLTALLRELRKRRLNIYREMNESVEDIDDSDFILDYEDETNGQIFPIESDQQLLVALETVAKLKLRVTTTRSEYQHY